MITTVLHRVNYRRPCAAALWLFAATGLFADDLATGQAGLGELTLEQLINVPVTAGTLGGSELRRVPASVTIITHEEIEDSGARNLNELLEIYVPELLYLDQNWEGS